MATNGADVVAYKDNEKYVIQVKFYNNPVGNKAVQEVVGAIGMYKADKGIVVTNSTFTPSAVELANANNVELVDREKIEKFKKSIINAISDNNRMILEDISEEYIDEVGNKWSELLSKEHFTQIDDSNRNEAFELLAKIYYEKEDYIDYSNDKVEAFVRAFSKYTTLGDDVLIENREDKVMIETYIKIAIYRLHFMECVGDILNDVTIDEEERKRNIYYEYFWDNMENAFVDYKILFLANLLDISSEDIVDEILYYKEKFEKEGMEYWNSKTQKLLDKVKQYTDNSEESDEMNMNTDTYNVED